MDLNDYRAVIDQIDDEIIRLFDERMRTVANIAQYKIEHQIPVLDNSREMKKLLTLAGKSTEDMKEYIIPLYSMMFEVSRNYQNRIIGKKTDLTGLISNAIENTEKVFPSSAVVACQGVAGANSMLACKKLFKMPDIMYFSSFEAVFQAIEKGMCKYGIIPVENSTAGTVNKVYDLMMHHHFHIVKSVRLKVEHNLLVKPGTSLSDIKEIYSHEQAIAQCAGFLEKMPGVKVIPCENTAVAAQMVANSDRKDMAALSSRECMRLYGLECLGSSIQDQSNNYTRFICICRDLEIYPGADRTSLMAILPHEAGSLYKLLARFYALGINLNKLESRPLPDRDFEFMFYFDMETPVYAPQFAQLISEMPNLCEEFSYLGSYSEVF